jgi:hypothetical protein
MSASCYGLTHICGKDRRQALAMLLGGGLAGTALGAPQSFFEAGRSRRR